jgi:hypothetical protein
MHLIVWNNQLHIAGGTSCSITIVAIFVAVVVVLLTQNGRGAKVKKSSLHKTIERN